MLEGMADQPTLVLHRSGGGEPLLFNVNADERAELERKLPLLLDHGSVETVRTAEDVLVSIHFGQIAVAYIDAPRKGKTFGIH